ncbi:MAG: DUF3570 domain-containing protein [Cyclobacteriaceae bacterium]|nr:DUF3570 domain-containing protein [Cyclobacteriaceae bacterium]
MVRIPLTIIGLYMCVVSAFSQTPTELDSASYKSRKLKFEEANFVTSYYHQEGNNSAVTGGIGTEKLTDISNTIDLKLSKYDNHNRLHSYNFELGFDTYTSASSDKVDPNTISSASSGDQRFYPSASWNITNEVKGQSFGANIAVSSEYDYLSFGGGLNASKNSKDNNRQVGLKIQAFIDQVSIIYPIELRPSPYSTKSRNSFSSSLTLSQIINRRLQVAMILDLAYQNGFLSLPFNRVYFSDNSLRVEKLPDTRFKVPIGFRANYFLGDRYIVRAFYRYYQDDWGMQAHTANIETSIKLSPFISVSPFYRFHTQSAIDYFSPYQTHNVSNEFYSSDFDLSKLESHSGGIGFRAVSADGILGITRLNMIEIRFDHYNRSTGLASNIISLHAKFK